MELYGEYFCGNKISEYGLQHKRLDYGTLAKGFDCVDAGYLMEKTWETGYWEQESGLVDYTEEKEAIEERLEEIDDQMNDLIDDDKEDSPKYSALEEEKAKLEEQLEEYEDAEQSQPEVYQYFIVSHSGAEILEEINEIVYYNEELNLYVWGVTHWGTSWDYVLTDVPCMTGKF